MPQLSGGDDLGANDELIAFKDEGEQEEKRNASSERDLDDVKSSLVNESESSSDSEVSGLGSVLYSGFSAADPLLLHRTVLCFRVGVRVVVLLLCVGLLVCVCLCCCCLYVRVLSVVVVVVCVG